MRNTEMTIKNLYIGTFTLYILSATFLAMTPMLADEIEWFTSDVYSFVYIAEQNILSISLIVSMIMLSRKLNSIASEEFKKEKRAITTLSTILVLIYLFVTIFSIIDRFLLDDYEESTGGTYAKIEEVVFTLYGYLFPLFII